MRFAVGDVHGYRREVRDALAAAGLVDSAGDWSGGDAEVWFAGDLMDRGPDGVGVVSDVMRWQRQAGESGGYVGSVLGNHEVLALGMRRFGDVKLATRWTSGDMPSFASSWLANGGRMRDQELLTDEMASWLADLPALVRTGDDLLIHADTTDYLRLGSDAQAVNARVSAILHGDDLETCWRLWAAMTQRYAFLGEDGPARARAMLEAAGGSRVVHGHSIIGDLRDISSSSVEEAWLYADGLVLAVDGGVYDGGPSLVVPLDSPSAGGEQS
jgi:hypothetical protein